MKFAKKFMVVPFREQDDEEIEKKKSERESNQLTSILQDDKMSDSNKYNSYNQFFQKIQSKKERKEPQEAEIENKQDITLLYEKIKDLVENNTKLKKTDKKKQTSKSIKSYSKTPIKKEILDIPSKKKRKHTDSMENSSKNKMEIPPLSNVKQLRLKTEYDNDNDILNTGLSEKLDEELNNISLVLKNSDFNTKDNEKEKVIKNNLIKQAKFLPKQIEDINKVLRSGNTYSINSKTGASQNWEHLQ